MKHLAKQHILTIEPYRPGRPIEEVKRELGLKHVIKLASNESPYGPSPKVLKAIVSEAQKVNRYPDGGVYYLRQELAKQLRLSQDQFIFGNGSDEIIVMALRAFVQKNDEVIIAEPSFLIYKIAARMEDAKIHSIPLENFYYNLEGMRKAVTPKTKIIFIGNPDNPAGTYINDVKLRDFVNNIPADILIFIDEAYYEYVRASDYPDSLEFLKKHKNIIVTRTFSKMYGLAGLRVGYGMAHKEVIEILNRVREPFNVNSIAQAAALACLKDKAYYRRIAKSVEEQRQFLYSQLQAMGLPFIKSVTNFILIDVQQKSAKISQQLLEKGVIIRDMEFWGLNTFIRVTIGREEENRKFLRILKEILYPSFH